MLKVLMDCKTSPESSNALQRVLGNYQNYAMMCHTSADAAGAQELGLGIQITLAQHIK